MLGLNVPAHIDTSGLENLRNFMLPSSIGDSLRSLNNSIPSPADLKVQIKSM